MSGQLEINGIYTLLNLMEQRFHNYFIQLNNQVSQMNNRQSLMQEQIDYMIAQQDQKDPFSCSGSLGTCFPFEDRNDHDNSSSQLHSDCNVSQSNRPAKSPEKAKVAQSKLTAKSQSKRKKSKDKDNSPQLNLDSSAAPSKRSAKCPENEHIKVALNSNLSAEQSNPPAKSPENEHTKVAKSNTPTKSLPKRKKTKDEAVTPYYKNFPDRKRGEPANVNVGEFAGLENKNVYCYSNAILQSLASCMVLSDFSPSETHAEFALNHAFASLMNSMVESERSVDPSAFMTIFMPLFRPPKEIEPEVDADEQEGMYYDFV